MEELQQAMDEFLQELTRQAMEQGQQMPPEAMQQPRTARRSTGATCRRCSTGRAS